MNMSNIGNATNMSYKVIYRKVDKQEKTIKIKRNYCEITKKSK